MIVGVSTDELVLSHKHKKPVVSYEERKAIAGAIKYVDQVVPQTSMDKLAAWNELHFDAIFHGDDWKGTQMYNDIEKKLEEAGCDMVFLSHTKGTSSTLLLQALYDASAKSD